MTTTTDPQYIKRVLDVLNSNPTSADLDFLITAFANVGYLAAVAAGQADMAEAERKYQEASAYRECKETQEKVTDKAADAYAVVTTVVYRREEAKAREKATKLKNLMDAIEQAINGVKHLDRNTSGSIHVPRMQ